MTLTFVAAILTTLTIVGAAPSRQKRQCKPTIELSLCDKDVNIRYSYYFYYQMLDIELCPGTTRKHIVWTLQDLNNDRNKTLKSFTNKVVVPMKPETLLPGAYVIRVKVVDSLGESVTAECRLEVIAEPPLFLFVNGKFEKVVVNESYAIDLTPSKVYNREKLQLTWKVTCVHKTIKKCRKKHEKHCVPSAKGMKFTHSISDPCVKSVVYSATTHHAGYKYFGNKLISVVDKPTYGVELVCHKNCDKGGVAISNPKLSMILELRCYKNCDGFDALPPTFSAELNGPNNTRKELPSDNLEVKGLRVTVKPNTYGYQQAGRIVAKHEHAYTAFTYIETLSKVSTPRCKFNPKEGVSLITTFVITCVFPDEDMQTYPPFMSIYQPRPKPDEPLLLTESANLKYKVILAAIPGQLVQRLTYKGNDVFFSEFEGVLPPIKVRPIKLTDERVRETLEKIEQLTRDGYGARSTQYMQALMQAMKNATIDKATKQMTYAAMMKNLHSLSVANMHTYNEMGSMIPHLIGSKEMPRHYRLGLSRLCDQLSRLQLDVLKNFKYVMIKEKEAKSYAGLLRQCTDHLLEVGEMERADKSKGGSSTESASEASVTEDYENYDSADVNTQVEDINLNVIHTILKSSQAVGSTLDAGETYSEKNDRADTSVEVETGEELADMKINVTGAEVRPSSPNLKAYGDRRIAGLVTSYKRDLLESENYPLVTRIVDVAFYDLKESTDRTLRDVAAVIILDVISDELLNFQNYTLTVPVDWRQLGRPEIDYKINTHRLNLHKHNVCFIRFGVLDDDVRLKVVITMNRRPNYDDFGGDGVHRVNASDPDTKLIHCPKLSALEKVEDVFLYVGVLPDDDMSQDSKELTVKYAVQFIKTACMILDEKSRSWVPATICETSMLSVEGVFKFNCTCAHTSLFAGSLSSIQSKLNMVMRVPFHSRPFHNYMVFVHVAVVFLCYCIALTFENRRRKAEIRKENMFFLSDNLKNDLYCYLIFVKTGSHAKAGTTSNVMVQIFGDRADSKPHVLNYPDPEMRLLQRNNQDCFAMSSDSYLGDLCGIHLWYDSVGQRPSWYCDNVVVLDLQTRREWLFPVEKWLTIKTDAGHEVRSKPSAQTKKSLKNSMDAFFRFYFGGQHLWNVFVRTNDDRITFAQRITVLLSMIYTAYVVNMMYSEPPSLRDSDAFGLDTLTFGAHCVTYGLITSVVCSAIHHPLVYIFRNSHKQQENIEVLTREDRRFSYRVNKATWCLLAVYVALLMTYLITFGFYLTPNSSYYWALYNLFAIFFEVVLIENLYLVVVNVVTTLYAKWPVKYFNFALIKEEIEAQRRVLFGSLGEVMLRPYFRRHYEPMKRKDMLERRQHERERSEVALLLGDMCVFFIYVMMLYVICFTAQDDIVQMCNRHMRKMVNTDLYYPGGVDLAKIDGIDEIYGYINKTVLNVMHPQLWYGKYFPSDAGQMIDFSTKVLGVVQLRQQRRVQNCMLHPLLAHLKTNCHNPPLTVAKVYDEGNYNTYTLGKLGYYNSGGYKTTLGRTLYNSYFVMKRLHEHRWIDVNTEVLFVEFWTYTANTNVFNAVTVIIERDLSGRLLSSSNVYTMQLIFNSRTEEVVTTVVAVVLIVTSVLLTLKRLTAVVKFRGAYCRSIWNVIDFTIAAFSIINVYYFFVRERVIKEVLERLALANHNEYVEHAQLVNIWHNDRLVAALLICLSTLRLWKFLRFGTVFRLMELTLFKATGSLFSALVYHITTVVAFAVMMTPMFGSTLEPFHYFGETINSLLLIPLNFERSKDYRAALRTDSVLYLIVLSYTIISRLYYTVYATIVIIHFEVSKMALSNAPKTYSLKDFVVEESKFLAKSLQRQYYDVRLRAGAEETAQERKVYPKSFTERYANLHSLRRSRMEIMRDVATCVARLRMLSGKPRDGSGLTEADLKLMARLYLGFSQPPPKDDSKVLFFSDKEPTNAHRVKFVPDRRLRQMEYVTTELLGERAENAVEVERVVMNVSGDAERLKQMRDHVEVIRANVENIRIILKKRHSR